MNKSIVCPVGCKKGRESQTQEYLKALLDSIVNGGYLDHFQVILCYDQVGEDFYEYFEEKYPFTIGLVWLGNKQGFAANSNLGIRHAKGTDILLVNQDCVLPDYKYMEPMFSVQGIATPYTCGIQRQDLLNKINDKNTLQGEEISRNFAFCCPYISKEVIEEVGLLEPAYISSWEDDDFITRALLAGFKCFQYNVAIYHKGSHSNNPGGESPSGAYNAEMLGLNMQKYMYKYGISPEVTHAEFIPWVLANRTWNKEKMYIG